MNQMYGTLYNKALEGDADCGGILSYGNYAGEPITNVEKRTPNGSQNTRDKIQSG